jgi:hypothetical protein
MISTHVRIWSSCGFSFDLADLLMEDVKRCLGYFDSRPVSHAACEADCRHLITVRINIG